MLLLISLLVDRLEATCLTPDRLSVYHCLLPGCGLAFTNPEALEMHAEAHFVDTFALASASRSSRLDVTPLDPAHMEDAFSTTPVLRQAQPKPFTMDMAGSTNGNNSVPAMPAPASAQSVDHASGPRFNWPGCDQDFGRLGDMERHAKKHQQRRMFQCPVPRCGYGGNYPGPDVV